MSQETIDFILIKKKKRDQERNMKQKQAHSERWAKYYEILRAISKNEMLVEERIDYFISGFLKLRRNSKESIKILNYFSLIRPGRILVLIDHYCANCHKSYNPDKGRVYKYIEACMGEKLKKSNIQTAQDLSDDGDKYLRGKL